MAPELDPNGDMKEVKHFDLAISSAPADTESNKQEEVEVVCEIVRVYKKLAAMKSLKPTEELNGLFNRLVELCIRSRSDKVVQAVLENEKIKSLSPQLRNLCSTAEGELEAFWAKTILSTGCSCVNRARRSLRSFPYYSNYEDLCRLECSSFLSVLVSEPRSIAFIGSGPLPLTSFCFADRYPNAFIHNIDRDGDAIQVSTALSKQLGYTEMMSFSAEDALGGGCLSAFDVVCVAALVGMDAEDKFRILKDIVHRMREGALLLVRSAHSLRGLLYPVSLV